MPEEKSTLPTLEDLRPPRPPDAVQSLERGLSLIKAFDGKKQIRVAELTERTGLSRSAVRRLLMTLVSLGYVAQVGKAFELTPGVLWLGYTHQQRVTVADICRPHVKLLARQLGTSSSVAVLEGSTVRYICRVVASNEFAPTIREGSRLPAHRTSLGRAILAFQSTAQVEEYIEAAGIAHEPWLNTFRSDIDLSRERGWSFADQLLEVGIQAVAVPLRNGNGDLVGAISTATSGGTEPMQQFTQRVLSDLQETARRISKQLGSRTTPV